MELTPAVLLEMQRQYSPLQGLMITFRNDSDGIRALSMMGQLGRYDRQAEGLIAVICSSGTWGGYTGNRKQLFWPESGFDWNGQGFLEAIKTGIEKISVASDGSPFQAMLSGRKRMVQKAVALIINNVVTPDLYREVEDWGCSVRAFLDETRPLPVVTVVVNDGKRDILVADLCGWSGNVIIAGREPFFCCGFPVATVQIRKAFSETLETMTS